MTTESFSKLQTILTTYELDQDDTTTTSSALSVYNKVLGMIEPIGNVGNVSDDLIRDLLLRFDYRNSTFQQDVDTFCVDIRKMLRSILTDDRMVVFVVSVLLYSKNTDIKLNLVNNLINDIRSLEYNPLTCVGTRINLMADLFKNNIIGSQTLSIDSASQMMKVVSSASDLLGSSCVNSSSNRFWCANNCLKTPEELGIKSDLIIRLNQQVMDGATINPKDLFKAIRTLSVGANYINLDRLGPTIYDIAHIRFCWFFSIIHNWILNTPGEETARRILQIVIKCLLETDKSFKDEDDDFLVLEEMVLNVLDHMVNGKSYYTHIRAKNLKYKGGHRLSPENLNSQIKKITTLQREILEALNNDGYVIKHEDMEGLFVEGSLINTNVNQGNCRDGNGTTENLYESMSVIEQTIELDSDDYSDIKKLLGESFKLSTMLDEASSFMKSRYNESVQWNA